MHYLSVLGLNLESSRGRLHVVVEAVQQSHVRFGLFIHMRGLRSHDKHYSTYLAATRQLKWNHNCRTVMLPACVSDQLHD